MESVAFYSSLALPLLQAIRFYYHYAIAVVLQHDAFVHAHAPHVQIIGWSSMWL